MINLLILGRGHDNKKVTFIVAGAILPDAAMFVFYLWQLALDTPESSIWSVEYHRSGWQAVFDLSHSIPLALLGMLFGWKTNRPWLLLFFTSILLHALGDLPLHQEDAHRHFFPLSDWRFFSPVSYWNPAYYGDWVGMLEFLTVFSAAIYLYLKQPQLKFWIAGIGSTYLVYWIYVMIVWA
jgi:hypothetical protein